MLQGNTEDDGYGILFELCNDERYALFRVREKMGKFSVVQTEDGGDNATVFIRQAPAPSIRKEAANKLAILAIYDQHWFYINDAFVGHHQIDRLPSARLDVGIVAGCQQQVICGFRDFKVYTRNI